MPSLLTAAIAAEMTSSERAAIKNLTRRALVCRKNANVAFNNRQWQEFSALIIEAQEFLFTAESIRQEVIRRIFH